MKNALHVILAIGYFCGDDEFVMIIVNDGYNVNLDYDDDDDVDDIDDDDD